MLRGQVFYLHSRLPGSTPSTAVLGEGESETKAAGASARVGRLGVQVRLLQPRGPRSVTVSAARERGQVCLLLLLGSLWAWGLLRLETRAAAQPPGRAEQGSDSNRKPRALLQLTGIPVGKLLAIRKERGRQGSEHKATKDQSKDAELLTNMGEQFRVWGPEMRRLSFSFHLDLNWVGTVGGCWRILPFRLFRGRMKRLV